MRLTGIALVLACAVAVQVAGMAQAAEPTPPAHIQKCYDNATSDADIVDCINVEAKFWDNVLNDNYKMAMRSCTLIAQNEVILTESGAKEFEVNCKKQLKETQRTWIKYRDGMAKVQCNLSFNYGGTLQDIDCAAAYKNLVKEQALKLWRVYGNENF